MLDLPHHTQVLQTVISWPVEELIFAVECVEAWEGATLAIGGIYTRLNGVGCGGAVVVEEIWGTGSAALEDGGGFGGGFAFVGHCRGETMSVGREKACCYIV